VKVGTHGKVPKFCRPCRGELGRAAARDRRAAAGAKPGKPKAPRTLQPARPAIPPPALEAKAPRAPRGVTVVVDGDSLQLARKALEFVGLKVLDTLKTPNGLMLLIEA
jgi:hypothetical protein